MAVQEDVPCWSITKNVKMSDFNIVHKVRRTVENQPVDIILIKDEDFRTLMLSGTKEFIHEHQQEGIPVILVGCPSLTSVVPEGINFPVSLLIDICQEI